MRVGRFLYFEAPQQIVCLLRFPPNFDMRGKQPVVVHLHSKCCSSSSSSSSTGCSSSTNSCSSTRGADEGGLWLLNELLQRQWVLFLHAPKGVGI